MKIAVVGGGAMGASLIRSTLAANLAAPDDFIVLEIDDDRRAQIKDEFGIVAPGEIGGFNPDLVYIAVKPQDLDAVQDPGMRGKLIVSIAAGVPIERVQRATGSSPVVRAMPNTPSQVGRGITVWTASDAVNQADRANAKSLFRAMGDEIYAPDESVLDKATALSGSGPAYVFLFLEALADAGVSIGLAPEDAKRMAVQTVLGSAEYAQQSGRHLAELRNQVTSPAGTTAAALRELERAGLRSAILEAVHAARDRAEELGRA